MRIVILGNGFAGVSALETILQHNTPAQVTLISGEDHGFYSPASLFAYLEGRVSRPNLFLRDKWTYAEAGIQTFFGKRAVRLDAVRKAVHLEDGTLVPYDRLLIATGAGTASLGVPGETHRGVFKLDTLADAEAILAHGGRQVVIAGAGRIGVELAAVLREGGAQVTLVEVASTILPGVFDPEITGLILDRLWKHGVQVHLEERIVEVLGNPVEGVRTNRRTIPCDTVIVAIGRRPNVGFVDGREIRLGETGGIWVDQHLRANEDVYAAGDCAETADFLGRRALHAVIPKAVETGHLAALNMLGHPMPYQGSINANVLIAFGRAFFSIGLMDGERVRRAVGDKLHLFYVLPEGRLVGAQFAGEVPEAAQAFSAIRRGIQMAGEFRFDALRRRLFLPAVYPSPPR
ncbi:MAG: NAD(P)/FAD-dependent oxidoreductase [Anaerolineae bacterium]